MKCLICEAIARFARGKDDAERVRYSYTTIFLRFLSTYERSFWVLVQRLEQHLDLSPL